MNQSEIRMFAPWTKAATLPEEEIAALTFERCLELALEIGLKRFNRSTLAKLCGIHYPHFGDLIAGKRPFPAPKVLRFCMFCGCDYPRQWLLLQEKKAIEEYRNVTAQALGEHIQQSLMARSA